MENTHQYFQNKNIVQMQIQSKLASNRAYFPDRKEIYHVDSGIDLWPYPKMFQGSPSTSVPKVWDRQAGYQKITSAKSSPPKPKAHYSDACFQPPCNTLFPCEKNKNFLPLQTNCVFQSP